MFFFLFSNFVSFSLSLVVVVLMTSFDYAAGRRRNCLNRLIHLQFLSLSSSHPESSLKVKSNSIRMSKFRITLSYMLYYAIGLRFMDCREVFFFWYGFLVFLMSRLFVYDLYQTFCADILRFWS